jgi:hypothetical protein
MRETITERALIRRINRVLKATNEQLRRPRAACVRESVGDLLIWNWTTCPTSITFPHRRQLDLPIGC